MPSLPAWRRFLAFHSFQLNFPRTRKFCIRASLILRSDLISQNRFFTKTAFQGALCQRVVSVFPRLLFSISRYLSPQRSPKVCKTSGRAGFFVPFDIYGVLFFVHGAPIQPFVSLASLRLRCIHMNSWVSKMVGPCMTSALLCCQKHSNFIVDEVAFRK